MLQPIAVRTFAGITISGHQVDLQLEPDGCGNLSVTVIAHPCLTGFDGKCVLSRVDRSHGFVENEIKVSDNQLECMAVDGLAPFLFDGFRMVIEPGVAPLLRVWLPRLFDVARLAEIISSGVDNLLRAQDPPVFGKCLFSLYRELVAFIVLDGISVEKAITISRENERWTGHPELFELLKSDFAYRALQEAAILGRTVQPYLPKSEQPNE